MLIAACGILAGMLVLALATILLLAFTGQGRHAARSALAVEAALVLVSILYALGGLLALLALVGGLLLALDWA